MTRGYSLEQDLKLLINNPKYSDIEILCEDERKLYGCRAILAARSERFDRLCYNEMKDLEQICFPKINSFGMEMILEYTYTGSIKEESLTKDNIIEVFYAAGYFELPNLQDFILQIFKNNYVADYSPELLSKVVGIMPFTGDNIILNLLVEAVAIIPLNAIEFGRLSIAGLRYLLSCTQKKDNSTSEYNVFRYSAILAAKQVSDDAYKYLIDKLPISSEIENSTRLENTFIYGQQVAKEMEPLLKFIDFKQIDGQILMDIIEPLEIIPSEIIMNVYRYMARSNNSNLNNIRGVSQPTYESTNYVWDESGCGSKLQIEDSGRIVRAPRTCVGHQNVKAKMKLDTGIFEWDVIIEKYCEYSWIGICTENFDYNSWAGKQSTGWVLCSSGYCCNFYQGVSYCPPFSEGSRITVHLDMNKKSCAFTVNGVRYSDVTSWNNLPSILYPVVSLKYPGCFRIQPHQRLW